MEVRIYTVDNMYHVATEAWSAAGLMKAIQEGRPIRVGRSRPRDVVFNPANVLRVEER